MSRVLRATLFLTVALGDASAQLPQRDPVARAPWSVTPYFGAARHSAGGQHWGVTPDRDHYFVGLHLATPVLRAGPFTLMYAPNILPLVVVTNNPHYKIIATAAGPRRVESGRGPAFGTGLVPFGLQVEARVTGNVDLYSTSGIGGVWFDQAMPEDGARRFNFSIEVGGGAVLRTQRRHGIALGYKFHHFSNMYTARRNPGVDGHVIYGGVRWQFHLPRE